MIDIYLVTGFLGAGKTSLMKNLLGIFKDSRVAMIVNEFGQEGVDGAILDKEGMVVEEIIDGSIFCVCKSDKFIQSILKTKDLHIDYLIVESSGLADSFGMPAIMGVIDKLAPMTFHYSGSICVVDAVNFLKVYEIAPAVKQQVQGADLLVINKTDIATADDICEIGKSVRRLNNFAEITRTSFSRITDNDLVHSLHWHNPDTKGMVIKKTIGVSKFILKFDSVPLKELVDWLKEWSADFYRVKGFCSENNKQYYVQAVPGNVTVSNLCDEIDYNFLVVLGPAQDSMKEHIEDTWKKRFEVHMEIA